MYLSSMLYHIADLANYLKLTNQKQALSWKREETYHFSLYHEWKLFIAIWTPLDQEFIDWYENKGY